MILDLSEALIVFAVGSGYGASSNRALPATVLGLALPSRRALDDRVQADVLENFSSRRFLGPLPAGQTLACLMVASAVGLAVIFTAATAALTDSHSVV